MVSLFNIAAFFIVLREVLEACLVVGIVLACLKSLGNTHLRKWVWWGAGSGIVLSLVLGITFVVVFYTRGTNFFSGKTEKIFEGIVFLIAAALLTWMIIWMQHMGRKLKTNLEKEVERKIEQSDDGGKWGIFFMVFVQVLREGIETWIFLFGAASASDDPNAWKAIPIPGILGVVVGIAVSYALFRGLIELDINSFFFWTSVILMLFSAGLTSHAFHELQEVDWFGPWAEDKTQRDWWNARLWSTKPCCNDKYNEFFAFLRALFGYQDTPTFVEWSTYFAYWLIIIAILLSFNWGTVRKARNTVAKMTKSLSAVSLCATFIAFIYVLINRTWNGTLTMTLAFLLSIASIVVCFDFITARAAGLKASRKTIALGTAVALGALTIVITILHIVQMACDEEGVATCSLPRFYYACLIFAEDWASQGRAEDGNSWVSLAVLSWSMVICFFFWGTLSFVLYLYSMNIDAEGNYIMSDDSESTKPMTLNMADDKDEVVPEPAGV